MLVHCQGEQSVRLRAFALSWRAERKCYCTVKENSAGATALSREQSVRTFALSMETER